MNQPHIWVVVADAAEIHVFRSTGNKVPHQAKLEPVEGGVFHRGGHAAPHLENHARHTPEPSDDRRHAIERQFFGTLFDWLTEPSRRAQYAELIIAAPAQALGDIRAALPPALAPHVVQELRADLVKLPIKQIEEHVAEYLNPVKHDEA